MKGWYDQPQWDYFDENGCVDYIINNQGLRDDDFELARRAGGLRVVAIGDSFTFGAGVQMEDCWPEVLERMLDNAHDEAVEVINAGLASGHEPSEYASWLARDGLRLQPDAVIVGLCLNDLHPRVELYAYRKVRPQPWLGGRSELLKYLQQGWANRKQELRNYAEIVENDPKHWNTTKVALARIQEDLRESGIRFIVAILPMLSGLGESYPYQPLIEAVVGFCLENGIEHVDLLDRLPQGDERELWVHPTDQHPNDRGHRLIAEGVFEYLCRRPLEPPTNDRF